MGSWVLKTRADGQPSPLFISEANGLNRLKAAGCSTPDVRLSSAFGLVLRFYPPASIKDSDYTAFATQLAELHLSKHDHYGDENRAFLGVLPLDHIDSKMRWHQVFVQHRLNAMYRKARAQDPELSRLNLDLLKGLHLPTEGPCLIHGDLWQGNLLATEQGLMMIDPSCWIGERAIDIAMLKLFGNLPNSFWTAYLNAYPLPKEVESFVPLYQLYYALAHVALFGSSYTELCARLWQLFIEQNT